MHALYIGRQVRSTRTGMSFLMGIMRSEGGVILKSVSLAPGPPLDVEDLEDVIG